MRQQPLVSQGLVFSSLHDYTQTHHTPYISALRGIFFWPNFVRVVYFVSLELFWYLDEGLRAVDFSIMKNPTGFFLPYFARVVYFVSLELFWY
jgi:hypothetical protein